MSDDPTNEELVAGLVRLLTVEKRAADVYAGPPQTDGIGRVFGGQVLAQALQAAQATVSDGKAAHSLHAYFLRGGREGAGIEYRIERDFDGRSFANRRVVASQEGEDGMPVPILNLTASFQLPEEGLEHLDSPMPEVARPETLRPDMELRREIAAQWGEKLSETQRRMMLRPRPIEMRTIDRLHWMSREPREPRAHTWLRPDHGRGRHAGAAPRDHHLCQRLHPAGHQRPAAWPQLDARRAGRREPRPCPVVPPGSEGG